MSTIVAEDHIYYSRRYVPKVFTMHIWVKIKDSTLDKKAFSRQIASYIDFNTIRDTLKAYDKCKNDVLEKSVSFLGSQDLKKASDWGLYSLLSNFLEEFKIPEETIDFLLKLDGENIYSDEAINWLKNYEFSGKLVANPDVSHLNLPFDPIVMTIAESGIIDILHCPTNFIFSAVENFSATWRELEKYNPRVFLEPSSPSELFVFLEQSVSSHYKNMDKRNAGESAGNSIFSGYRYVCLTHELGIDTDLLAFAEKSAIEQAKGTIR
jgi:hypothetical protein